MHSHMVFNSARPAIASAPCSPTPFSFLNEQNDQNDHNSSNETESQHPPNLNYPHTSRPPSYSFSSAHIFGCPSPLSSGVDNGSPKTRPSSANRDLHALTQPHKSICMASTNTTTESTSNNISQNATVSSIDPLLDEPTNSAKNFQNTKKFGIFKSDSFNSSPLVRDSHGTTENFSGDHLGNNENNILKSGSVACESHSSTASRSNSISKKISRFGTVYIENNSTLDYEDHESCHFQSSLNGRISKKENTGQATILVASSNSKASSETSALISDYPAEYAKTHQINKVGYSTTCTTNNVGPNGYDDDDHSDSGGENCGEEPSPCQGSSLVGEQLDVTYCYHKNPYISEMIYILKHTGPIIVTFLLQFSLTVASIFSVGHLGETELAAASLAAMTANITGFAVIQGLATCLDTLCAQSFGAKKYHLVGQYLVKCILMIMTYFIFLALFWLYSEPFLELFVAYDDGDNDDNKMLVPLAACYLKTILFGIPGYIMFECGKRFIQAQGIFYASTCVLVIVAPLNAVLNYTLVWSPYIGIGFRGAPIAVAISQWLMAILLYIFIYFVVDNGKRCWPTISFTRLDSTNKQSQFLNSQSPKYENYGSISSTSSSSSSLIERELTEDEYDRDSTLYDENSLSDYRMTNSIYWCEIFKNWNELLKLAVPGVMMTEAEFLAFEVLTISASKLGTAQLAAQSVLATMSTLLYQIPFSLSIATSTRIANLLGAGCVNRAQVVKKSCLFIAIIWGSLDSFLLYYFRHWASRLFSDDETVIKYIVETIPVLVICTTADAPCAVLSGILRGLGRQCVGGYLNLFSYYTIAIPISLVLTFMYDQQLKGLWAGISVGLICIDLGEYFYTECLIDFDQLVREVKARQEEGHSTCNSRETNPDEPLMV